jgi:predicted transcriptional regulator YdeE
MKEASGVLIFTSVDPALLEQMINESLMEHPVALQTISYTSCYNSTENHMVFSAALIFKLTADEKPD